MQLAFRRTLPPLPLRIFFAVAWAFALVVVGGGRVAHAFPLLPGASPDAGAERPKEEDEKVAPDSPRASLSDFLALCDGGKFADAARYLELGRSKMESDGARLAQRLDAVLKRRLIIDLDEISPKPLGNSDDGLPGGIDEIGRIPSAGTAKGDPVRLVRRANADGAIRWQFSSGTVDRIDVWYDALQDKWLRDHLPGFWFRQGFKDVLYWQWLAIPVLAALAFLVAFVLTRLVMRPIVERVLPRPHGAGSVSYRAHLRGPIRLAWAAGVFALAIPLLSLDRAAEGFVTGGVRTAFDLAIVWGAIRLVDAASANAFLSAWGREHPAGAGLMPLIGKLVKITLVFIGALVLLSEFGYPVGNIVAGLGIGGLAFALAAQKTVENLFGGVSIGVDQPFRVGDFITVDGISGTVESLGIRSTRIRTPDRTTITIPNGKLADMRIENGSTRDRFRCNLIVPLRPNTPADVLKRVVDRITERVLASAPEALKGDSFAHIAGYRKESTDIEVNTVFATTNDAAIRASRLELILDIARIVADEGAFFADPHEAYPAPTKRERELAVAKPVDGQREKSP